MRIPEIYNIVREKAVRAYLSPRQEAFDETWHFGQRGTLGANHGDLVFYADSGPDKDVPFVIAYNTEIHAPSIGHHTWGKLS